MELKVQKDSKGNLKKDKKSKKEKKSMMIITSVF